MFCGVLIFAFLVYVAFPLQILHRMLARGFLNYFRVTEVCKALHTKRATGSPNWMIRLHNRITNPNPTANYHFCDPQRGIQKHEAKKKSVFHFCIIFDPSCWELTSVIN